MGKNSKEKNAKKRYRPSSGKKYQAAARVHIRRLRSKIKRWKRYQKEGRKSHLSKNHICKIDQKACCAARHRDWDTTGLEKQLSLYENIIKRRKKTRY